MKTAETIYTRRIAHYRRFHGKIKKKCDTFSTIRGVSFVLSLAAWLRGRYFEPPDFYYGLALVFFATFIAGIFIHRKLHLVMKRADLLQTINRQGLARVQNQWTEFPLTGDRFLDPGKPFLTDLHIFGKDSLFQMIQLTSTRQGERRLAAWLDNTIDFTSIPRKQKAVRELSSKITLWQRLLMEGRFPGKPLDPARFLEWVKSPSFLARYSWLVTIQRTLVPCTFILMGLSWFYGFPRLWIPSLIVQAVVFGATVKKCREYYLPALEREGVFLAYSGMFALLEKETFASDYLKHLKSKIMIDEKGVSRQMKRLQNITGSLSLCHSSLYPVVNILCLWDIHYLHHLELWKAGMCRSIETCFEALAEVEALSSLAGFLHDNPGYTFPVISETNKPLQAGAIGHPLIPVRERVVNDFTIPSQGFLALITGSNMSGKSTFIRTVGINMVLAFAGAPVAAKKFLTRPCTLVTCIEVHDSLRGHISHFYAEVKGIKKILEAVYPGNGQVPALPCLYLIDEIFSGTNTRERLIASEGIIIKLTKSASYGLLTTHDLDLAGLEKKSREIKNFHFKDEIDENGKMFFAYRIHDGPVSSTNALKILENEGISVTAQ